MTRTSAKLSVLWPYDRTKTSPVNRSEPQKVKVKGASGAGSFYKIP